MKPVPTLEDVSPEYSRLMTQHHALMAKADALDAEILALHAAAGEIRINSSHGARVDALLRGVNYQPPSSVQDEIADKAAERRAVDSAIRDLSGQIKVERVHASRLVTAQFADEHRELARQFFTLIAAATEVHAKFGELRLHLARAGIDNQLFDFGEELCGAPSHRNGRAGLALREAVKRSYLKANEVPEAFR